jgi:hypothetical protein
LSIPLNFNESRAVRRSGTKPPTRTCQMLQ